MHTLPPLGRHAVVIGGSIAGLLAARVLSDRFERVTVFDRDAPAPEGQPRKGVPQGRHAHGIWPRGLAVMERLLPGLRQSLVDRGAQTGDVAKDFCWHQFGALKSRIDAGMPGMTMTRPLLESAVRERVARVPTITLRHGVAVDALLAGGSPRRVRGVRIADADIDGDAIAADLVVDASGRGTRTPAWLADMGFEAPPETELRIDVGYASRFFERLPGDTTIGHVIGQTPPQGRRGGVALACEGGRWLVTLIGFVGERPPLDEAGFADYARSLPHPGIHEIVTRGGVLSEPQSYRFAANLRRHYEKLARFPDGLLVVGDAICSFNPAYGQGMTVAAAEVEVLESRLQSARSLDGLALPYFRAVARVADVPWQLTTGEDWRYPEVPGQRPAALGIVNPYVARMHRVAGSDPAVARAFFQVAGLQKGPQSLFAPAMAWRILRGAGLPRAPLLRAAAS